MEGGGLISSAKLEDQQFRRARNECDYIAATVFFNMSIACGIQFPVLDHEPEVRAVQMFRCHMKVVQEDYFNKKNRKTEGI